IGGIRRDVAAFPGACGMPVTEGDGTIIASAQNEDAPAILLRAVHVVGKLIVNGNVIELRGGLVVPAAPGSATIHGNTGSLVAAKNHAPRVVGIDPHCVVVVATGSALDGNKRLARVGGAVNGNVRNPHGVWIFGININFAEIP